MPGWTLALPVLLDEINEAGIPDSNVDIILAVGGRRQNSREEITNICGKDVARRVRIINHDAWDSESMVYLGKTSRGTEVAINRLGRRGRPYNPDRRHYLSLHGR